MGRLWFPNSLSRNLNSSQQVQLHQNIDTSNNNRVLIELWVIDWSDKVIIQYIKEEDNLNAAELNRTMANAQLA